MRSHRYLLLEFPCLTICQPPQHFLEIGCGCGSSLLPVLKANPACTVTGTDLSPTAVHMFKQAAAKAGIAADRVTAFAVDSTQSDAEAATAAITGTKPEDRACLYICGCMFAYAYRHIYIPTSQKACRHHTYFV